MTKSELLRRSLRCLSLGWWGLIPVLGIFPAMLAFVEFRAVVLGKGNQWNAARRHMILGVWLATAGVLLTLIAVAIFVIAWLDAQ